MICIKEDADLEDIEKLKQSINDKIDIIKLNTHDEETLEKWEKFSNFLQSMDSRHPDDEKKSERYNRINKSLSFYQRFKQAFETDLDIDPSRLMGLTDGIFGMVMTLLIFGIALPEIQITNYTTFLEFISSLVPTVGVTIVSFVLISSFWIYHHEFIKIKNLNIPYLWLNILFLISISFIPFTTSLIGNYSQFFLSDAIFGLNIFLTIVSFLLMFHYAYKRRFLEVMPSKEERSYIFHTFFIIMALTVVVNLLDFNVSKNFIYLFLLVPVISTIRDIRFRMEL